MSAALSDVVGAAVVALINTGTNQTIATSLTDSSGNFIMNFSNGYAADPTATYYLEASKGLDSNLPGHDSVRVRTIVRYADGWTSLNDATPSADIVVTPSTTALAIGAALVNGNPTPLDFSSLIGRLSGAGTETYAPVTGVSAADFNALRQLVNELLAADQDPVTNLGLRLPSTWHRLDQRLSITTVTPARGTIGTSVGVLGTGFDMVASNNTVAFNGASAVVTSGAPTRLDATVPLGATSGPTTVRVGNLVALGPNFTVPVVVSSISPTSGPLGEPVTITGSGFAASAGDNVVTFNGVPAAVILASPTSLTVRVPLSTTGPLAVTVSGQTASGGTFTHELANNPMLTKLSLPTGGIGPILTLDGTFGSTAIVNFPGGRSSGATLLSAHRAQVIVPTGAISGSLTVTTNGATTNSLPFWWPSFNLGLHGLQTHYDQTSVAKVTPVLRTARNGHASTVIGNFLYVLGGEGSDSLDSIERAPINADGTLGDFTSVGSLLGPRSEFTCEVIGQYLYVLGGNNGPATLDSVERAPIHADGTLGAFTSTGVTLSTARSFFASEVIGNYLYVIGGVTGGDDLASVERAPIDADGTLGAFSIVGTLSTSLYAPTSAVIGNYLYVMGGCDKNTSGTLDSVERATINPDGTLGAFSIVGTLSETRLAPSSAVIGSYLYVMGGTSFTNGPLTSVERAPINADGTLGPFSISGSLSKARIAATSVLIGNYLYVIGGLNGNDSLGSMERASIHANGTLGAFSGVSTLSEARFGHTGAVIGNYLYVIGGTRNTLSNTLNSVERASLDADGKCGAFSSAGVTLIAARYGHASAVIGNHLYVMGGFVGGNALGSVERAPINSDGSLGSFSHAGVTLSMARTDFAPAVIGNYLYVVGGYRPGTGTLNSVERAPINADGVLGSFSSAGVTLATARYGHTCAVIGDFLYVIGGTTSDDPLGSVERAAINADGTLGPFSNAGVTLTTARRYHGSAVIGGYLYVLGGYGSASLNSVERAPINAGGTLGAFSGAGVTLSTARDSFTSAAIGNYLYVLGGASNFSAKNSVEHALLR